MPKYFSFKIGDKVKSDYLKEVEEKGDEPQFKLPYHRYTFFIPVIVP